MSCYKSFDKTSEYKYRYSTDNNLHSPFRTMTKDTIREYVPGNSQLLPIANPAAPAIINAEISSVP